MARITDLPIEVLIKIFKFYMQTVTQKRFLNIIGKVCDSWKIILLDPSLWTKYDGTPTFDQMITLSKKGVLKNTKELILSSIDSLQSSTKKTKKRTTNESENAESLKTNESAGNSKKCKVSSSKSLEGTTKETLLFQNVQNVEVISFSQVKQISDETLSIIAQNCPKLKEIKIGNESKSKSLINSLNYKVLVDFLSVRGSGIRKIDFSFCKIRSFPACIRCISDCCPNLEYLHLMNIDCSLGGFPTSYVQSHCPKLKSLNLDEKIRICKTRDPSGFPSLEQFVYSDQEGYYIDDKQFECIVFNSPKLKFLSLTNCDISASAMLSLPACSVEYLYILRSKASCDKSLCDLLEKWSHSLKEINLSYGDCVVQHAILKLVNTPVESPLEFLDLRYTPVNLDLVESIIKNCQHLETLKLEGCRNLLRGMKRTYSSKLEIKELTEKINSYRSTNPSEVITVND